MLAEQLRVELAEAPKLTLEGVNEQVSPVEGEMEADRFTTPVKVPRLERVIVELADELGVRTTVVGATATE